MLQDFCSRYHHRFWGCPWTQCDIIHHQLYKCLLWWLNTLIIILLHIDIDKSWIALSIQILSAPINIPSSTCKTKTHVPWSKTHLSLLNGKNQFIKSCQKYECIILTMHVFAHIFHQAQQKVVVTTKQCWYMGACIHVTLKSMCLKNQYCNN